MRASMVLFFALAVAGCKRTSPTDAAPRTEASATPTPPVPPPPPASSTPAPLEDRSESFFDPDAEGQAALVVSKDSPNMRYAQLAREACIAELGRRGIAFDEVVRAKPKTASKKPVKPAPPSLKQRKQGKAKAKGVKGAAANLASGKEDMASVLAPVRLRGALHGIAIHSALPEKVRATSPIEVFDCRLVLALDDFAAVLAKHDVVEVVHLSAFRPVRDRGCFPKLAGKQHCGALAVDIGSFKKKDGSFLDVDKDFNGRIGTATCTAGAHPTPVTPAATDLWDIVCDSARRGLFHVMLTPNYNSEHKNHFHVEITPGVQWMLIK